MIVNSSVTLYNSNYNKEDDCIKYNRTHIRGVNFQDTKAIKVSETKGILSADIAKIFIPFTADTEGKQYIKPKAYKRLTDAEKYNYFTFSSDDKIVKGIIDFELTGKKPNNDLKYLENMYDDVYNIMSVSMQENGSHSMHHWEVGAK